jgi:putative transposase
MSVRINHSDESHLYFITFTCYEWLPLFNLTNSYDLVYKWFNYLKQEQQVSVTGFVVMPNHMHCMLFFPQKGFDLNNIIGNAKRFIAYEIIERLKVQGHFDILNKLTMGVSANERKKGQLHKVFQDSFDAKAIESKRFLLQKLNYIHLNPVKGNYKLAEDWRAYEHSSASFYELNKVFHFAPLHQMELQ